MNARGIQETLGALARTRQRLRNEMRRADGDKAAAEARLADPTALEAVAASYDEDLRARLQALEEAAEQKP